MLFKEKQGVGTVSEKVIKEKQGDETVSEEMIKEKQGSTTVVESLINHQVDYVFGIPGAKIDGVFNELEDHGPELIVTRHEQNRLYGASNWSYYWRTRCGDCDKWARCE